MKLVVKLADRHNNTLDVLAVVQVLLRLFITLLEIDFDRDHLFNVSLRFCLV